MLVPGLAIVLAMPIKAGAAVTFNQQIPFSVVSTNPCPPGNPIAESGNIHIVGTFTIDASSGDPTGASGGVHGNVTSNSDSISAYDTVTGNSYQVHTNGQTTGGFPPDSFKFNVNAQPGSQIEFTQDLHGGLISQGSDPNLNFQLRLHMTFLSDGTLTADVSRFTVTCQ
jgi:hypothetical protein